MAELLLLHEADGNARDHRVSHARWFGLCHLLPWNNHNAHQGLIIVSCFGLPASHHESLLLLQHGRSNIMSNDGTHVKVLCASMD